MRVTFPCKLKNKITGALALPDALHQKAIHMDYTRFRDLAEDYHFIPVYQRITADLLTPVLAYLKLRDKHKYSFLLESVEGIGRIARYSFIGRDPSEVLLNHGTTITRIRSGKQERIRQNLFHYLQDHIRTFNSPKLDELPDFSGGIVGYLGYENVALIEDVLSFKSAEHFSSPDSIFGIYQTILAFDHYKHQLLLITYVDIRQYTSLETAYSGALETLHHLRKELAGATPAHPDFKINRIMPDNGRDTFYKHVESCKRNIHEGDIFQIVLSKRFQASYAGDLLNVYRALRIINPSPYMYFMELDDHLTVIGTSPEDLLRVHGRQATILPIAGTRKRGKDPEEDKKMEDDLINDPKELSEHVMLVDLARNDLGRVCRYDSVRVTEEMKVQRYSHVMHLVSRVEGTLDDKHDCIDALMAAFPAGTLTGAPKIRAMELIEGYENVRRNIYGGAVGYIDFCGNLDMCIAIRTLFAQGESIYWQAGAGIVADSKPDLEYKEITNKSAVMLQSLKYAEVIDEDSGY